MEIKTITKNGLRFYQVGNKFFKSNTSVVGLLDKPAIQDWAIRQTVEWIVKQKQLDKETIAKALRYSKIRLNELGDKGTAKHKAAQKYLLTKEFDSKDKWIKMFIAWKEEVDFKTKPQFIERVIISESLKCAGRVDMLGTVFGEPMLIDIKTSSGIYLGHKIQVCGYKLMSGKQNLKLAILQIPRTGYKRTFHILSQVEEEFCSKIFLCLNKIFDCMLELGELKVDKAILDMV
ncbi:hypothetical protein LCGC14_0305730 [marine sediment metagenome]|uniref:PD-(D/E)XK endonuclease-like domain-containing protein n=1 Tax=marine sediment metagenome TaxID=412755 RepID=A0A0F9TTS2_9ZZZZ